MGRASMEAAPVGRNSINGASCGTYSNGGPVTTIIDPVKCGAYNHMHKFLHVRVYGS